MKSLLSETLRRIGNIFYHLNGGLEKVNNGSKIDRLTFWFWARAYGQTLDIPPRYTALLKERR